MGRQGTVRLVVTRERERERWQLEWRERRGKGEGEDWWVLPLASLFQWPVLRRCLRPRRRKSRSSVGDDGDFRKSLPTSPQTQ